MNTKLRTFFSFTLGRSINWKYPSNQFITILTVLYSGLNVVYLIFTQVKGSVALWYSFLAGMTVFLSWALTREIDPDHPLSANLASIFTAIVFPLPFLRIPSLMLLFAFLMTLRVINNTVGGKRTLLDAFILFLILPQYLTELKRIWTAFSITTTPFWLLFSMSFGGLFALALFTQPHVHSLDDLGKKAISTLRVKIANSTILLFLILEISLLGKTGFSQTYPAWLAFIGYTTARFLNTMRS